jgi:hypothetical protein
MSLEDWEKANASFMDGTLLSCDTPTLQKHLLALSNQQIRNETIQHRDVIRGLTINHILLQRHIDSLNEQNAKTERWVIALAVAALIAAVVQTTVAIRAELRAAPMTQSSSPPPQKSAQPMAAPTLALPQSSHPTKASNP